MGLLIGQLSFQFPSQQRRHTVKDMKQLSHKCTRSVARELIYQLNPLSWYVTKIGQMAGQISTSTFNQLGQYTSSQGCRDYCYRDMPFLL